MKILRHYFILFFCFLSLPIFAQNVPTIEAQMTLVQEPGGESGEYHYNNKFLVHVNGNVTADNITKTVFTAKIFNYNPLLPLPAWESTGGTQCGNVYIKIKPSHSDPHTAIITSTFDNYPSGVSNSMTVNSCSEAQLMIVSGDGNCGDYGLVLSNASIEYVNVFGNPATVTPNLIDDIHSNPCPESNGQEDPPAQPRIAQNATSALFPNPANEVVNINITEKSQVQIFDLNGRMVFENMAMAGLRTIDSKDWNSGIYFVKIYNVETNELEQHKLNVIR